MSHWRWTRPVTKKYLSVNPWLNNMMNTPNSARNTAKTRVNRQHKVTPYTVVNTQNIIIINNITPCRRIYNNVVNRYLHLRISRPFFPKWPRTMKAHNHNWCNNPKETIKYPTANTGTGSHRKDCRFTFVVEVIDVLWTGHGHPLPCSAAGPADDAVPFRNTHAC